MKNIKSILLGIMIFYITIISLLLLIQNEDKIVIKNIESYSKNMTVIKEKIEKIKNENCQSSLNKMVTRINETNFQGETVTVTEYYKANFKDNETFIDLYQKVVDNCSIKEKDSQEIYFDVLSASVFPMEVRNKYLMRHELTFKDKYSHHLIDKEHQELGTYTTKAMELKVLKSLIEVAND